MAAYGLSAPKEWYKCPECHLPLHEDEHCGACGLLAKTIQEKK